MIQNKGSDTLVNVANAWAEAYRKVDPEVAVAVSSGGSGTGISQLIDGNVDIANASRSMKPSEIEQAEKNGIEPVEHVVGYDALAVYVHKDNPLNEITLEQLGEIYGEGGKLEKWSQLGVDLKSKTADKIVRVSRQNSSGTYAYFKAAVMKKGQDYKLGSNNLPGSKEVVEMVSKTPGAIGYSGLAYATEDVKMLSVKKDDSSPAVAPSINSAIDRSYPIARPLFMYTAGPPEGAIKAYLDWILSDDGQRIIMEKGYAPVRKLN